MERSRKTGGDAASELVIYGLTRGTTPIFTTSLLIILVPVLCSGTPGVLMEMVSTLLSNFNFLKPPRFRELTSFERLEVAFVAHQSPENFRGRTETANPAGSSPVQTPQSAGGKRDG